MVKTFAPNLGELVALICVKVMKVIEKVSISTVLLPFLSQSLPPPIVLSSKFLKTLILALEWHRLTNCPARNFRDNIAAVD